MDSSPEWPTVLDLVDRGPWYKNRGAYLFLLGPNIVSIVLVNFTVILALLTSFSNGFDGSMAGGIQLVEQWQEQFHNPTVSLVSSLADQANDYPPSLAVFAKITNAVCAFVPQGIMTSVQNIGSFLALPIAPVVSDMLGRKKGIFVGGIFMLGGVALQCQSVNITQFILARGMIGFGLCISINAAPLLITELAYPTQRGPITAIYNTNWYVGSILAAWTTFGTFRMEGSSWSWRIPSLLQALPSLLQVTLIWFCPESPRWLIAKGKDMEAKQVLGKYHGNGNIGHPLVDYEYNEIREAISMEQEVGQISWMALFSTPGNRRRMRIIVALAFFSQWSGNGLVSYYINLILESVGVTETATKTLINGCLQIFNLIMAFTSALFVDRIGRRKLFVISNAGMLLVFVGWTVTSAVFQETGSKAAGSATIAMIFIFFALYDIAYTPLLIAYTIEILPFKIRAKGFAAMSFTVTLGLIFNQYVNPVALEKLGWKYYLIYVGWLAFELGFIFLYLLETKGRTLEQTAMLFDGEPEERNGDMMSIHDEERRPSVTQSITRRLTFPKLKAAPSSDTMDKDNGSDDMEMKKSDWSKDANSGRDVKF